MNIFVNPRKCPEMSTRFPQTADLCGKIPQTDTKCLENVQKGRKVKKKETTKKAETAKLDGVEIDSGKKQAKPDSIRRLKAEFAKMVLGTEKLAAALRGEERRKVSFTMAKLMQAQYYAMSAYGIILDLRKDLLRKEGEK